MAKTLCRTPDPAVPADTPAAGDAATEHRTVAPSGRLAMLVRRRLWQRSQRRFESVAMDWAEAMALWEGEDDRLSAASSVDRVRH